MASPALGVDQSASLKAAEKLVDGTQGTIPRLSSPLPPPQINKTQDF